MHPILLTGVALVGMPILLHLIMRQEPKRQPLPTFRFLKMKKRINERKIRLRHWLLLAMRMLLIALVCLALFQPTLLSDRFNIRGEQPIAAVIVLDTSPNMGYILVAERTGLTEARQRGLKLLEETAQGPWTMLDEARARALELLDDLPPNSKVAIIDSSERLVDWSPTAFDARKKIQSIKKPRGNSQPVSRGVEQAYGMFTRLDSAMEGDGGPMPRLLVVLSDRFSANWDSSRLDDIKAIKDKVPPPAVHEIFLDVGIDKPVNLAIREVQMPATLLDPRDEAVIRVTVEATGQDAENIVSCSFDGESGTDKKQLKVAAGEQTIVEFRRSKFKVGLHTVEIKLETPDALPFDNIRYFTFVVRESHKVLCIADGEASYGWLGGGIMETKRADMATEPFRNCLDVARLVPGSPSFSSDLVFSDQVVNWKPEEWSQYEVVALCSVANPSGELWTALQNYLNQGGKVVIFPGGPEEMKLQAYDNVLTKTLLPGTYKQWIERPAMDAGWDWEAVASKNDHPLLATLNRWRKDGVVDVRKNPMLARKYWRVEPRDKSAVVVRFDDNPIPEQRNPAILEQRVGDRNGRVMLFAMTFNDRRDPLTSKTAYLKWNNYAEGYWTLVLSNFMMRYLVGESTKVPSNYYTGQMALLKWPAEPSPNGKPYYLSGPDVLSTDILVTRVPKEIYYQLPPEKTITPGNYTLASEDKSWIDGFSLNVAPEVSKLDRVPLEQLEPIFGKDGITPVDKALNLREILKGNLSQPLELFPFLMVLLLLFMAFENLLANKFYRS